MDNQTRVVELLTEQNELLKKHLARLKFSLMSLLLMMTATCCGLGFLVWARFNPRIYPAPVSGPSTYVPPSATISYPPAYVSPAMPTPPDIPRPKFKELPTVPLNNPATG